MASLLMLVLIGTTVVGVAVIFIFEIMRQIYQPRVDRNRTVCLGGSPWKIISTWRAPERALLVESLKSCAKKIRQDIVLYPPKGTARKPDKRRGEYTLRVYLWSVPELCGVRGYPPNACWSSDSTVLGFVPTEDGITLYDEERNPVAQLVGNELYILYEWGSSDIPQTTRIVQWAIMQSKEARSLGADAYYESCVSLWRNKKDASVDEALCQLLDDSLRKEIQEVETERDHFVETSTALRSTINDTVDQLHDAQLIGPGIAEVLVERHAEASRNWEALLTLRRVESVSLSKSVLTILTEPLVCRHPKTRTSHQIGRFRIEVMLDGSHGCVRWFNLDHPTDRLQAPGVHADGLAFVGNTTSLFPELIGKGEIAKVVKAAIRYIERVSSGDTAADNVKEFPVLDS